MGTHYPSLPSHVWRSHSPRTAVSLVERSRLSPCRGIRKLRLPIQTYFCPSCCWLKEHHHTRKNRKLVSDMPEQQLHCSELLAGGTVTACPWVSCLEGNKTASGRWWAGHGQPGVSAAAYFSKPATELPCSALGSGGTYSVSQHFFVIPSHTWKLGSIISIA